MSLSINEVAQVLAAKLAPEKVREVVQELNTIEAEKKEDRAENGPKQKNQYAFVLLDPNNALKGQQFVGLVVQYPENESPNEILPKIYNAAYTQNRTAKRKRWSLNTVAEAAESVKRKFFKEQNIHVKTKEVVPVIISDNIIPKG
jgi:hypothetical protein